MRKFYGMVIKHSRVVMILFLIAVVFCAWCWPKVSVNYDMNDYLPSDSPSTMALEVMEEEFGSAIPNARVMIRNVDRKEALDYKTRLEAMDGILSVMWVTDTVLEDVPLEMIPEEILETYYRDGNALFIVTLDEERQNETVPAIYELIGEENAMTGSAVSTVVATLSTVTEIQRISAAAVAFLVVILILTTTSWLEPLVVLAGLGVAILINAGSNLIFGEISFVTNAAGNILQLAVSLDYSVFLIHRFDECRKDRDPKEAMLDALTLSTSSIVSSGLTTVIGFLALVMMRFRIGPDLGLALAKGVAISLLTVFLFMPGLILVTYKGMDKTRHRSFMPTFRHTGSVVRRITVPLAVIFALTIAPAYYASTHNSYYYGASNIFGAETRLGRDTDQIEAIFGESDTYVLMIPLGNSSAEYSLVKELEDIPEVTSITSVAGLTGPAVPAEILPDSLRQQLQSSQYDRIVISVAAPYESDETSQLIETIQGLVQMYFPDEWYLAGEGVSTYDLMNTVTADMLKVNLLAIGAVFLVLLITMRSVSLPVILVLTIETAIWINLAIYYLAGQQLFYIAYLIISSIQLGATVDYAILFTDRYRENRTLHSIPPKACVVETVSNTAGSILTSAMVMTVIGFLMGAMSSHGLLSQLGYLLGRGTLCSLVAVLFVLPGLLKTLDRLFIRPRRGHETT